MARVIPASTTRVVGIAEYMEHVRANVELRDEESLADSALMLRALANDRSLLATELNRRMISLLEAAPEAGLGHSILLGRSREFYVRANIWPTTADMTSGRTHQDQFAYNLAHDHNFSFLTVTYLGPGYETDLYEYDYAKVEGFVGEPVDLRFVEKVRFGGGTVMLYRASRDVHVQYPPEEMTITLNLMTALPESSVVDQFFFDMRTRTISGHPGELVASRRATLVRLAGYAGDGNTQEVLRDLAARHPCRRTRLAAYDALSRQLPAAAGEIWTAAAADRDALVSRTARQRMEKG
jgi:hypothetical protein